jgi:hypothetical protein
MTALPGRAVRLKRWFIALSLALNCLGLIYSLVRLVVAATAGGHDTTAWAIAAAMHGSVLAFARAPGRAATAATAGWSRSRLRERPARVRERVPNVFRPSA